MSKCLFISLAMSEMEPVNVNPTI